MIKVSTFADCLRGVKQPRASVVGCKANARSQKRDICLRIIDNFSIEKGKKLFLQKQLRSNNNFLSYNFIKSLSFCRVFKKEENGV